MAHKIQNNEGIRFCINCGVDEFSRPCQFSSDIIENEKVRIENEKVGIEKSKANNGKSVTFYVSI